jgi:hypothetical protein
MEDVVLRRADMQRIDSKDGKFTNPGYEYLKMIYLMKDAQAQDSSKNTSPYFYPLLALQSACLAIEGYVDLVGRQIDPVWDDSDQESVSIKKRVTHIYKKAGKKVNFRKGIWKDVLTLYNRARRIRKNPSKFRNAPEAEIPKSYRDVAKKYPIHRSQAIAEEAVEALLDCSTFRPL